MTPGQCRAVNWSISVTDTPGITAPLESSTRTDSCSASSKEPAIEVMKTKTSESNRRFMIPPYFPFGSSVRHNQIGLLARRYQPTLHAFPSHQLDGDLIVDFVPAHSSEGCVGSSPNFPCIRLWLELMLSSSRISDHF